MKIKKHLPVIIGFVTVVGLSGLAYYLINKAKYNVSGTAINTRQQALDIIIKNNPGIVAATLSASSDSYLIAWAQAISAGKNSFAANGATFITASGTQA